MGTAPQFTSDWFTPSLPTWQEFIFPFAGKAGLCFLEIGCWEGRSACWVLENVLTAPDARLICVDTFRGELLRPMNEAHGMQVEGRFDRNIRLTGAAHKVTKLKGESRYMLRQLPFSSVDFAYIDGSHCCDDVLRDAVLVWDMLRPGGIMMFDDYDWRKYPEHSRMHPKRGVDAFLSAFSENFDLLHKGYQVVIRKHPAQVSHGGAADISLD